MMKRISLCFLLVCGISLTLQSCLIDIGSTGVWRNKTIDQDLRDEMGNLNKKLFKDIMDSNVNSVKKLMSEALLKNSGKSIDTLVKYWGGKFKAKDYKVLDEFYVKNSNDVTQEILRSDHENSSDYQLEFVAINKKTYASVLISKGLPVNCMVLAIYGKYDNGWKLNMLELGEYSVMDQTAPEYYEIATDQYTKENYVDAGDMIVVATQLANPGGKFFYYLKDHDIKDTYSIIMEGLERSYKFPLALTAVKTQPWVFHITPQVLTAEGHQGVFPVINYLSQIPLKDTVALRTENIEVQKSIGSVFKGVDKNKPCIVYRVFNKMPTDSSNTEYYQFFQTIKYSTRY